MRLTPYLGSATICALLVACGGSSPPSLALAPAPVTTPALTPPQPQQDSLNALRAELESFRSSNNLPGLSLVIVDKDEVKTVATGKRKLGGPDLVQASDHFQIGSLTKAMTATVILRLVEQKKLKLNSTLSELFPQWKDKMHVGFYDVTVEQLLRHRAGLKHDFDDNDALNLRSLQTGNAASDRITSASYFLQRAPELTAGRAYSYSNLGYLIAGIIAEQAGGEGFDKLLAKELFTPLQMQGRLGLPEDAGAAAVAGHILSGSAWQTAQYSADTRTWLSLTEAAGGVSVSMSDYGLFLREHLRGLQGKSSLLSKESFQLIHSPTKEYGLGWVVDHHAAMGKISYHSGSIGSFYGMTILIPGQNRAVALSCNCYSDEAVAKIDQLVLSFAQKP